MNVRNNHRSRTDSVGINQLQPQTRITASIIVPTLAMDREPQVRWATPAVHKQTQSKSFRLTGAAKPSLIKNGTKNIERAASTSLPDLSSNLERTQTLS
jgi:hypothetical protein